MTRIELVLPILGETVSEGTVSVWNVAVGESFEAGDVLLEVSTDKVEAEIEAPSAGVVEEIAAPEGTTIEVGEVLAWFTTDAGVDPAPEVEASTRGSTTAGPTAVPPRLAPAAPAATAATVALEPSAGDSDRRPAARNAPFSPVVRRLLGEHGLGPSDVVGTGRGDRVTKADVLAAAAQPASARAAPRARSSAAAARPLSSPGATLPAIDTLEMNVDLSTVSIVNGGASRTACLVFALLRSLESVAGAPSVADSSIVVDGRRLVGAGDLRVGALDGAIATAQDADDDSPISLWDLVGEPLAGACFAPTSPGAVASFTVAPGRTEIVTAGSGALGTIEFRPVSTVTASFRAGALSRTTMRDLVVEFARRIAHTDWSNEICVA